MNTRLQNIRKRQKEFEIFRTPAIHSLALYDYAPHWFAGRGIDPAAGDARMIRQLVERGNRHPHVLCDIRPEESDSWRDLPHCEQHISDYLALADVPFDLDFLVTNPPFTLAQAFVTKALREVSGPICILQSIAFQGTRERSHWLKKESSLRYVLNLPSRPKWELDSGDKVASNIWDFAWFVFEPGFRGLPEMDWLLGQTSSMRSQCA